MSVFSLVPRPSYCPVFSASSAIQFLITCSMQNGEGRPGRFDRDNHMNGCPPRKTEGGGISEGKNLTACFLNEECMYTMHSFGWEPLPPSVHLCYCKRSKRPVNEVGPPPPPPPPPPTTTTYKITWYGVQNRVDHNL